MLTHWKMNQTRSSAVMRLSQPLLKTKRHVRKRLIRFLFHQAPYFFSALSLSYHAYLNDQTFFVIYRIVPSSPFQEADRKKEGPSALPFSL